MKLLILLLFLGCQSSNETSKIKIINKSKTNFDKGIIQIDLYQFEIPKLMFGDSIETSFLKDSVKSNHDIVYGFRFYLKDSLLLKDFHYSNDLGYVPDITYFGITDSLKMVPYYIK